MNKKVAIILINYKDYAERFLADCRDSLRAQNYPKELFKIYIVDNASSVKSRDYLHEHFSEAVIIPRDDGNYAAANNVGLKKAIADGFKYFVNANMDTKFDRNWLKELVKAIENNGNIGLAQSKILLYKKNKINSLGNIIHFLGFGFTGGYNQPDREINGYPEIKGYASGCSFIIKKEVLDKIHGYNEELYMYHDDIDIGWKAKLAGYKIVLAPKSIVYHKYSFSRSISMIYYMERNRYIVIFTFYKILTIMLIMPALIVMDLGMFLFSFFNGWFKVKLRVYGYFLKFENWKKIISSRKKIQPMRKIKDKEIIKNFSGKVIFQEIDNPILKHIVNPVFNLYWQIVKRIIIW